MKLRDLNIRLNDDLETFMANIQPPITEENYNDILRCSERCVSEPVQEGMTTLVSEKECSFTRSSNRWHKWIIFLEQYLSFENAFTSSMQGKNGAEECDAIRR